MTKEQQSPIRVAVIGVGSFGRNHARVYRALADEQAQAQAEPQAALPRIELAAVVDRDRARAQAVAAEFGARACFSLEELLAAGRIHAASVAVPTVQHLAVARALMEAGIDVLVEKPLALDVAEADAMIELARRHQRVAQAGHLERFNPAVRAALPHITRPMFFEVHRLSMFTSRSLDVDVVMDLMIHDLDVVLSLVNSPVREIRAVGLPVLTPKVDIANVRIEFESGCVANFTASRVSTEKVRKLRFFQPHQYVSLDYSRRDMFMLTVKPPGEGQGGGSQFALPQIVPSKPQVTAEEPLKAELRSFLESVASRVRPLVPLEDGRRALALALKIRAQIEEHSKRAGVAELRRL
ncbi:MAG: Gfo/Idh/MocA family oxidoreductase [Candidatus Korobacteraceae bacterium]|jgi:predicted dehydrogenase